MESNVGSLVEESSCYFLNRCCQWFSKGWGGSTSLQLHQRRSNTACGSWKAEGDRNLSSHLPKVVVPTFLPSLGAVNSRGAHRQGFWRSSWARLCLSMMAEGGSALYLLIIYMPLVEQA